MASVPPVIPDYELLRPVGRGAYGEVWLARSVTGSYRAAKIVYRATFEEARPFDREFTGIQRFEPVSRAQENQITILHVGRNETGGYFYYVMELADDATTDGPAVDSPNHFNAANYRPKTLKEVLARRGRLPIRECLPVAIGLCNALEHLHDHGLIHRDVKPSNIIFVNGQPKLADIGLVSSVDATRSFVGTEGYVPREGPGSPAADLYGLGKVLYEITSGRPRQDFPLLPENIESLDDRAALLELNEVIVRACADNAADRYPSAADLRTELLLLQAGKSVRRLHAAERRLARLVPVVAGVCLLAGIALFVQHLQTRAARERARVAQEFRERAEAHELATRQLLYASDMNLVHQAHAAGDLGLARSLLSGHLPAPGQADLRGFEWHYFQARCEGEQIHTFTGFSNAIKTVAISADGTKLAAGSYDHQIRIWNLPTRTLETSFDGGGMIEDVGFSGDGQYLAYCGGAGSLTFRQLETGRTFSIAEDGIVRMAMSPTRKRVAFARDEVGASGVGIGTNRGAVEVWDYDAKQRILTLSDPSGYLCFSQDGRLLAAAGMDGHVRVWDIDRKVLAGTFGPVSVRSPVSFSPDGKRIAVGDDAGYVRIWELGDGRLLHQVRAHEATIWDIAYSRGGDALVTACTDQTARVWDAESLAELNVLRGHAGEVWRVAFSPDSDTLATGSKDGTVRIWSAGRAQATDVFTRRVEFWNWPVFSDDGELLAVGEESRVTVRRVDDGSILATLTNARRPLGFLNDGRELMALGMQGEIQFWNWRADTNRPNRIIAAGLTGVRAHAVFTNSNLLAVGDGEGNVRLWDFQRKTQLASWKAHSNGVASLSISPDGHVLASSSAEDEDSVKLWSVPDGELKAALTGHKLGVFNVAFSPKGNLLASASVDDTCRLWNAATGQPIAVLGGHKGGAFHAAFSPDGKTLVVGTGDNKVKLWNTATFRDMGTIDVEPVAVFYVGFVPRKPALATVSFGAARTNCSLQLLRASRSRLSQVHAASLTE